MTEQEKGEFNRLAYICLRLRTARADMERTINLNEWVDVRNSLEFAHAELEKWAIRNADLVHRIGREGS